MTTENADIVTAFDHPEARARATAQAGDPPDRISLRDHVVEADIGAFGLERGARQRLAFNVVVEVAAPATPLDDDVDRVLSYDTIVEAIALELAAERLNLLETLAERIAARILGAPQALRVFVRVEKLDRGPGALGVEIARSRAQVEARDLPAARPLIVLAQAQDPALEALIHRLIARRAPAILCPGAPLVAPPALGAEEPARRVALLALEQAAWAMAARDQRILVAASRTELDWALKQGRVVAWAPGKMVLDSPGAPETVEPATIARWLGARMGARRLMALGDEVPEGFEPAEEAP